MFRVIQFADRGYIVRVAAAGGEGTLLAARKRFVAATAHLGLAWRASPVLSDSSTHLGGGLRCHGPAVMKELCLKVIARDAVAASVFRLVLAEWRDVASAFLQDRCHFLVQNLVVVIDLVLAFLLDAVLSARRL